MSADTTEEKKHPPSLRRLDQLRRKGTAATSTEFRLAVGFLGGLLGLWWLAPPLAAALLDPFDLVFRDASPTPEIGRILRAALAGPIALGLAAAGVGCAAFVLASLADTGGLMISAEALQPKLEKLNPIAGLKEKFGLRAAVELGRSLLKLVATMLIGAGLLADHLKDLLWAPTCGMACSLGLAGHLGLRLVLALGGLMLISGLADLKLSRFLFARQHRMTDTEVEREQTEDQGSREINQQKRQIRSELAHAPKVATMAEAAIVITGAEAAVALAYDPAALSPPVIVRIARGSAAPVLIAEAQARRIAVVASDVVVKGLASSRRGATIPPGAYRPVGTLLRNAGLI